MQSRFLEKFSFTKRGASLRALLIYPFVILIVVAVISTGFLSLYNSGKAAEYMAWQLMDEIGARIEDRVLTFLSKAHLVNEINANAIESGQIDFKNMREQELHFWHQVKSFEYISYSYIGRADGGFFGARRLADGTLQTIATETLTGGKILYFDTDNQGLPTTISSSLPYYDHKTRPWYKAGIEAGKPTWSPVFIDAGGEGLTITAATPLYDESKTIKGVLGCSFIFSHINQFLQRLKIGESGVTFIIERSGMLVATSTLDATYTADKKRIASLESENPKINQTGKSISEQFGDLSKIGQKQRLSIHVQGEGYFVQLSPLTDHRGIDWLIVVIVPENDFMSHIKAGNFNTVLLSLLALGLTVVVGFTIARRITRPILELNIAARSLADGEWSHELKIDRRDEVGELASSFNLMVRNLQTTTVSRDRLAEEIEERKKIESELQKLAAVVEHSSELVNLATLDGKMIFLNEAGGTMLGIPPHDVQNYSFMEVIPDELKSKVEREVLSALLKENRWEGELQYRNLLTGTLTDVQTMTFTIRNSEGEPLYLANISLDITERKRAEEALQKTNDLLRAIIEAAPTPIIDLDLDGIVQTVWNPAAEKMLGWSAQEAIGSFLPTVPADKEEEFDRFREWIRSGKTLNGVEVQRERRDGTPIDYSIYGSPLHDREGQIVGNVAVLVDITGRKRAEEERRRLEERLIRAEKMEALGTLAGGVAHDLNNVLGVLVGFSELLLDKIPKGDPLTRYVSHILQSSQRGAAIIQDLLTLARRGVAISEVVNLNDVVSDYFKTPEFENLKDYHPNVTFRTDFGKDLLNIKGSSIHLGKTVMNLVSNAVEAISGEGEVMIRTENRYLDRPIRGYDDMQEGDYVVLTVSDNGKGISPADLGKIFEPFYTKKVMGRSGTGLGLAVVWGTVKDHDGYIDVQSEEGKGSTFSIYLPVTREELTRDQQKISPDQYMGKGESILVVDDVEGQRELAVSMLTRLAYRARAVSSGEDAVAYIKSNKIDLLVLDMIMEPGIDGLETYQRVLDINPKQKAIIVSGFSETDRVRKAQSLGAGAYVKKPYVLEKLGLAIRRELERSA
jgi:two-component system, cell cycle sensor histidine kinase and response regulator CckA